MEWKTCDHQEREGFNRGLEVLEGVEFHSFSEGRNEETLNENVGEQS